MENGTDSWGAAPATEAPADGDNWGSGGGDEAATDNDTEDPAAPAFPAVKMEKDEFLKKARDAGWTETTAFNYEEFQRTGGNNTDYHGASRVYEWNEEYGEVGPESPELEHMLFGGEFVMRRGEHNEHLDLSVTLEAREQYAPICNASTKLTQNSLLIS